MFFNFQSISTKFIDFVTDVFTTTPLVFVYRNNNRKSEEYYSYNNNNFTKDEDKKDKSSNKFNDYLLKPLLKLFKCQNSGF